MQYDLEEEDKFIVLASDGIWEFLSNQEVIELVVPFYQKNSMEAACNKLVQEASARWKEVV